MKRLLTISFLFLALAAIGQNNKRGIVLPGSGHINTEQLNKKIDLTLDVEKLNLNEVRVLRNAFYARQGYPFKDAYLRGVFSST
ncbi:MAG: YARHG domain-containing protein, partial [Prevotella sp.]|nr:YARHG domain-containing protein [Prevotella sp.]